MGRPRVSPGEETVQLGLRVEASLKLFLEEDAKARRVDDVRVLVRQILRGYRRFRIKTCSSRGSRPS